MKRGWQKVAGVVWDDGNQVEQIKLKVDAQTRRIITRCNTMAEVWDALDLEYGQEQEVISDVDEELKPLKAMKCYTAEYIVELRNYLPTLEDALKGVNGLEHLCSPERVNFMVDQLDERTMFDWEYFRSKSTGTTYERFFAFLLDRYDAARSSIARWKSRALKDTVTKHSVKIKCTACNLEGHNANDCTMNYTVNYSSIGTGNECRRCAKWLARDDIYICPGRGRGTSKGEKISHCLEHCGIYMRMKVKERSDCVGNSKWCPVHLLGSHEISSCTMKNDTRFVCGINGYKMHHHRTLHGSTTSFVARVNSTSFDQRTMYDNEENVLLLVQSVQSTTGDINCFFDNGSSCCLITNAAACRLNLVGKPMCITITTVNGKEDLDSSAYYLSLIDMNIISSLWLGLRIFVII